jgi:hypothetical protein
LISPVFPSSSTATHTLALLQDTEFHSGTLFRPFHAGGVGIGGLAVQGRSESETIPEMQIGEREGTFSGNELNASHVFPGDSPFGPEKALRRSQINVSVVAV